MNNGRGYYDIFLVFSVRYAICPDRIWACASADNVFLSGLEQGGTASCFMSFGDILVGLTQVS